MKKVISFIGRHTRVIVLVSIIYLFGAFVYQYPMSFGIRPEFIQGLGIEISGFSLTILIAIWWLGQSLNTSDEKQQLIAMEAQLQKLQSQVEESHRLLAQVNHQLLSTYDKQQNQMPGEHHIE
jgi:hypothetical protein